MAVIINIILKVGCLKYSLNGFKFNLAKFFIYKYKDTVFKIQIYVVKKY